MLASFALHAAANQFLFMDFAPVSEITKDVFTTDDAGVNWLYTAALASAVPSIFLCMIFIDDYNYIVSAIGVASSVTAAWLRYVSVSQHNYVLGILSSIMLGPGVGVIFTGFTELPARCFPLARERHIASAVVVQSAFWGWAMGGLVIPLVVSNEDNLKSAMFYQAVALTLIKIAFLFMHSAEKSGVAHTPITSEPQPTVYGANEEASLEIGASTTAASSSEPTAMPANKGIIFSLGCMLSSPQYLSQGLSTALLEAVGFSVPAIQEQILADMGYGHKEIAALGFMFIMSGVLMGLCMGAVDCVGTRLTMMTFWLAAGSVSTMWWLTESQPVDGGSRFPVFALLVCTLGACTLGIINVVLPHLCSAVPQVPESHSGGLVEMSAFLLGSVLCQISTGRQFAVFAIAALVAAACATLGTYFDKWDPEEAAPSASPSARASSGVMSDGASASLHSGRARTRGSSPNGRLPMTAKETDALDENNAAEATRT